MTNPRRPIYSEKHKAWLSPVKIRVPHSHGLASWLYEAGQREEAVWLEDEEGAAVYLWPRSTEVDLTTRIVTVTGWAVPSHLASRASMDPARLSELQDDPTPNEGPHVHDLVVEDVKARKALGVERYGTPLQAHNGRDALRDAYEEALDLACYLRQALEETR